MEKIYDTLSKGLSFASAFKIVLDSQKQHDLLYVNNKYSDGYREDKVDQVEREYNMNLKKLDYADKLSSLDKSVQEKFSKTYLYIDKLGLDTGRKIETILTLAVLCNKAPKQVESLDEEELYLVSTLFTSIPVHDKTDDDQYKLYSPVVCDDVILSSVMNKTNDMNERRAILRELLSYCDYSVSALMNVFEYKNVLKTSLNIVKNYNVPIKKEENIRLVA